MLVTLSRGQNEVPGPVVHPRISMTSNADSTTVTSSEPAQPTLFEKKTNTYVDIRFGLVQQGYRDR